MKNIVFIIMVSFFLSCNSKAQEKTVEFPIKKSEASWKAELSPEEFYVLRSGGTERAFSSELQRIKTPGTFVCAADGTELYLTKHKFNSGTGWPSFDRPIKGNVVLLNDHGATEVVCATCGGHLGHVFNDGPRETTGKRYCMNGDAMDFIPTSE